MIHKSGSRADVRNYRAVCIVSEMAKVFDRIVTSKLFEKVGGNVIGRQHGFMPYRSTVTNLLVYQHDILGCMEGKVQVDAIYTDFAKAFDKVNHRLLLFKLKRLGLEEGILRWLESFLVGRVQWVKINGSISRPIIVTSGVPQGSHCGPLLFNLFVNDISCVFLHSKFLLYADDLKFYRAIRTSQDCLLLQEDLDRLVNWCSNNGLSLNTGKCFSISFYRIKKPSDFVYCVGSHFIQRVSEIRDLGVTFTSDMSFKRHVDNIVASSFKKLGFITRFSRPFSSETFRLLYCSLVRPSLEYASVVWSPYYSTLIESIERVQKRFLIICYFRLNGDRINYSSSAMARQLSLDTLEKRRHNQDMCFLYKLVNNLIVCEDLDRLFVEHPTGITRQRPVFRLEFHSTNYAFHGPISRMCRNFNNSNLQIHGLSMQSFRRALNRCD